MGGLLGVRRIGVGGQALAYEPTDADRAWVAGARAVGATVGVIAKMLCIPELNVPMLFPLEMSIEPQAAVIAAGVKLLERALVDGDVGALRYWLTTHGGAEWREPSARAGLSFGSDGRGNSVVTFVIEGFGSGVDEVGNGALIDEAGERLGPVSER